jgi:hypothetical protein
MNNYYSKRKKEAFKFKVDDLIFLNNKNHIIQQLINIFYDKFGGYLKSLGLFHQW